MNDGQILVTGADGYLGRLLVQHLLETTDRRMLLWVRSSTKAEAVAKCAATFGEAIHQGRITCAGGDLRGDLPFNGIDPGEISGIVHLAAATAFTVDPDTATGVNVAGTAKLLELARRCSRLESLCLASTLYVSGLSSGEIPETAITERPAFANEYERSKWEAERLALAVPDLPLSIVRIATVLADDESGICGQRNAVHNTLQMLFHGLLSMIPGDPNTPIYLSTGEFAAAAIGAALLGGHGVYNAAEIAADSLTLGVAIDVAYRSFSEAKPFLRRRIRRPRYVDLATFELLANAAGGLGGSVLGQALGSVLPFAPQLYAPKLVANKRLLELLPGHEPVDGVALLAATCGYLASGGDRNARIA
jgi:nucleoside-diphosphate-sugar epimerase